MTAPPEGIRTRRWNWPDTAGEKNRNARLTAVQVAEIRSRFAAGAGRGELAKSFGIHRYHVNKIVRGGAWQQPS